MVEAGGAGADFGLDCKLLWDCRVAGRGPGTEQGSTERNRREVCCVVELENVQWAG